MKTVFSYLKLEIKKNLFDYLLLITGGIFFLIFINIFSGQKTTEFLITFTFICFYILWGFYHHLFKTGIHLKVMLEYILIGFTLIFLLKLIIFP